MEVEEKVNLNDKEDTLRLIGKEFCEKNSLVYPPKSINDLHKSFLKIKEKGEEGDFNALYLINYLYENIASDRVRKRKVTARDFEDFIAFVFNGEVTDETSRHNDVELVSNFNSDFIANYIISNLREKLDVKYDNFGISVKTSMPDNKEINMGSFAREALFYNIWDKYGGERKAGLGSATQLKKLFGEIEEKGKWEELKERYKLMVKNIFQDDFLFVIKGGDCIEIYTLTSDKLQQLMIDAIDRGTSDCTDLLNRYEGNSIRIKRDPVLEISEVVKIDFNILKDSNLVKFLEELKMIEINTILYLNNKIKQEEYKNKLDNIQEIFEKLH